MGSVGGVLGMQECIKALRRSFKRDSRLLCDEPESVCGMIEVSGAECVSLTGL